MLIKELKYRMQKQNYTDFEISLVSSAIIISLKILQNLKQLLAQFFDRDIAELDRDADLTLSQKLANLADKIKSCK